MVIMFIIKEWLKKLDACKQKNQASQVYLATRKSGCKLDRTVVMD
jgi:hypothetical protein